MNFIFSTNPSHLEKLRGIVKARSPLPIALAHADPDWGAVVATDTTYMGLGPLLEGKEAFIALGDPLVDLPHMEYAEKTARSKAILKKWTAEGEIFPEHAAALLRINFSEKSLILVTDCCSFIPIFIGSSGDSAVVSNTPDFVEMVIQSGPDILSFHERLAALQNAFPYTLYKGVRQIHPGAVTTIVNQRVSVRRWWTAPAVDADIAPDSAREELRNIAADQMRRMVSQVGSQGALAMSAGADSRFAAICAACDDPRNLTAICQTAVPNMESETARQVAGALGMNFSWAKRPQDHYPKFVLSLPFYMGSHVAWDHGHFAMGALGEIAEAKFLLGGYWADTLFDDADMWNDVRLRYQAGISDSISESSRLFAASPAFFYLSAECQEAIGARWQNSREELGLGPEHSARLAGIYPASRSLTAGHAAAARYFYPDYQLFMNRRSIELGFRLSSSFKKNHGKKFLLFSNDERLEKIPVNPGQSPKIRALVQGIRSNIPEPLWPDWVRYTGPWNFIEGRQSRKFFRAARAMAPRLADALDLPAAAVHFRRNMRQATMIFQLGKVLGI